MRCTSLVSVWTFAVLAGLSGCDRLTQDFWKTDTYRFLSPEAVVRKPERSMINPILPTIGMADQTQEMPPNATLPQEDDYVYTERDYMIGPTDIVDVGILDLFTQGAESVLRREVTAGGFIDLPLLTNLIKAEGMTRDELKEAVAEAYRAQQILRDPTVSVSVAARRQNVFSILGAISHPGTYNIMRKDMRLLEALATAGGVSQTNIKYLYVIRPVPAIRKPDTTTRPAGGGAPTTRSELPAIPGEANAPPSTGPTTTGPIPTTTGPATDMEKLKSEFGKLLTVPVPATSPTTRPSPSVLPHLSETADVPPPTSSSATAETEMAEPRRDIKFIYSGGRFIPVTQEPPTQPAAVTTERPRVGKPPVKEGDPWGWGKLDKSDLARIIAINLPKLQNGDPRMNIVVRDNDIIQIPPVEIGEFYVMGEVARPGVYSLTGRRVTAKMAVAAAGNMTPLAWPENAMLIRRIGDSEEQMIPLNLEAIYRGEEPDIFLKADDVLAVGTHVRATFMAVMRNAFRLTYGFGFIYDRNFSDPAIGDAGLSPRRFTRW
jgi:protein involved in polysaccharide export with SLBB domain